MTEWCDEAMTDVDDRFIEDVARIAARNEAVHAVMAIVSLEDPNGFRCMAGHGKVAALEESLRLADEGSTETGEYIRALAERSPSTTRPFEDS